MNTAIGQSEPSNAIEHFIFLPAPGSEPTVMTPHNSSLDINMPHESKTFELFPLLPVELRLKTWCSVIRNAPERLFMVVWQPYRSMLVDGPTSVLSATHESRKEYEEVKIISRYNNDSCHLRRTFYINPGRDIMSFDKFEGFAPFHSP